MPRENSTPRRPMTPIPPEVRERRKVRFAITLQTLAIVLMGGTSILRAIAFGFDTVTVVLGVVALLFVGVLVVTVIGYRRMPS